jgi:hypothetical protein
MKLDESKASRPAPDETTGAFDTPASPEIR